MKKKYIIVSVVITVLIIGFFMYYKVNEPKLSVVPYPKYKIGTITIRNGGDSGRPATNVERERIINALYTLSKYEYIAEDHSYPPSLTEIIIETTDNNSVHIRNLTATLSIINLRYVIKCEEIHKILE